MGLAETPSFIKLRACLRASSLLVGLGEETSDDLARRFGLQPFQAGDRLIRAGNTERHLLVLVDGAAEVRAVRDGQTLTVARLQPGDTAGEITFFDPAAPRTADVIGTENGVVAILSFVTYQALKRANDPAAAVLERNLLVVMAERIEATNRQMGALLAGTESDLLQGLKDIGR